MVVYLSLTNNFSSIYAQQEGTSAPSIKILSHLMGQKVPTGDLTISGISSDDPTSDCQVSLIWNDSRPYQDATPAGSRGEDDFSNWTFTFTEDYHVITEGVNKLTSKITCTNNTAGNYGTKWYSVNVIGLNNNSSVASLKLNTLDNNNDDDKKSDVILPFASNVSADAAVSTIDSGSNNSDINCRNSSVVISDVKAIGYDGDDSFPKNAYDKNLETRWSHEGSGSWIQFDLGTRNLICSMDIAWYKGDERSNYFSISLSDDGNSFENVFQGTSSGTSLLSETYDFVNAPARFVKVMVDKNTDDFSDLTDWAAITEVKVN
jgi:F5/8 type C domain-containing protein